MTTKIKQALIGGIVATAIMTLFTVIAPWMGFPKMDIPQMLSGMLGVSIPVAWLMHFMVGIIFALSYAFIFIQWVIKLSNKILRGAIFGIAVFIFAQIAMAIIGAIMGGMPPPEGNMILILLGSFLGHILYGIIVALFIDTGNLNKAGLK